MGKTNKAEPDIKVLDLPASPALTQGGQDMIKTLSEPSTVLRPQSRKESKKPFTRKFFSYSVAVAGGNRH